MLSYGSCMHTCVSLAVVAPITCMTGTPGHSMRKKKLQSQDSSQAALHDMLLGCCTFC